MQKYNSIQVARALGAFAVVCVHVNLTLKYVLPQGVAWPTFLSFGSAGVDVFFVISGFIISAVLDKEKISSGDFVRRRLVRIFPSYWAVTTLWLLMLFGTGRLIPNGTEIFTSYIGFPMQGFPVLGVGWSLEHEFIFYAIAAALILIKKQSWLAPMLACFGVVGIFLHVILPERGMPDPWDFHIFSLYSFNFLRA